MATTSGTVTFTRDKELQQLEKLLEVMGRHGVAEIEWTSGNEKLKVRSQASMTMGEGAVYQPANFVAPRPMPVTPVQAQPTAAPKAAEAPKPVVDEKRKQLTSPLVGTFYRAPSPGAAPYAKEGQIVKKGDVLCIVEAMKLMNEIESEFNGKIVSALVENGQPVEFGEPLFIIETE
jgi:acetyl-CoA carboxylase biotin carboxyl carrier protein